MTKHRVAEDNGNILHIEITTSDTKYGNMRRNTEGNTNIGKKQEINARKRNGGCFKRAIKGM